MAASARKPVSLHIATSLKIISKHRHVRSVSVEHAAGAIKDLALNAPLEADQRLIAELEQRTGLTIAELAAVAERWT